MSEVILAMGAGKAAAKTIDEYVKSKQQREYSVKAPLK